MDIMDNMNTILWIGFGVFSIGQILLRWVFPSIRQNPEFAGLVETADSFWIAMAVALSLKAVLIQPFTIPSGSMEDTLLVGDYILVNKFDYGYSFLNKTPRFLQFGKPQRGDVVVFVFPLDHSKDFIKRCRGVPGDILEYKDKVLYVNGVRQVEPFVKHIDPFIHPRNDDEDGVPDGSRDNFGPVTVQEGHYFMMGDNRDNSLDSRYWGQVDEKLIKGKAGLIYWHSVGTQCFIVLVSILVGVISAVLLGWRWVVRKPEAINSEASAMAKKELKTTFYCFIVALFFAGFFYTQVGTIDFMSKLTTLKSRIFTLVR